MLTRFRMYRAPKNSLKHGIKLLEKYTHVICLRKSEVSVERISVYNVIKKLAGHGSLCMCIPILVTTFSEWLSGTEPLPHTPSTVYPSLFVVFCMHVYSFAVLIRQTPQPTFSDTAIANRHSDTTIFQLRAHWVQISWSIGSSKSFGHVPPVGVEPSTSWV